MKICRFDRNEFGEFLGYATVVYEKSEDAEKAILEYNGAKLDDKILTVEYDTANVIKVPKVGKGPNAIKKGRTLRVGGRAARRGGRR